MRGMVIAVLTVAMGGFTDMTYAQAIQSKPIVVSDCPIRPLHDVQVPVRSQGVLAELLVEEGDAVEEGQILGRVDGRLITLQVEAKKEQSDNTAPLEMAVAEAKEARAQLDDAKRIQQFVSKEEVRIKEARLEVALHKVEDSQVNQRLTEIELRTAEAQQEMHGIVSPITGRIEKRLKQTGEAVEMLEPVFHVIRKDVVKVDGSVHIRDAVGLRPGMAVDVFPHVRQSSALIFRGHTEPVRAVAVLPDGKRCVSAGQDGLVIIWNIAERRHERTLVGHDGAVFALACDARRPNRLISAGADGTIRIWDVDTGKLVKAVPTVGGAIYSLLSHPADPARCLAGHADRDIRVWNLDTAKEESRLTGHSNYVTSMDATRDGKILLSTGSDQTLRLWDIASGNLRHSFRGRSPEVHQINLSPTDDSFAFNNSNLVQIRSTPEGMPITDIESRSNHFSDVAVFAPSPGLILLADSEALQLWQLGDRDRYPRLVRGYEGHRVGPVCVDFAPDASYFVSGAGDMTVQVWPIPSADQIARERKSAKISFVSQKVEAGSETVGIRAEVDNADGVLMPGTFATMIIYPERQELARGE